MFSSVADVRLLLPGVPAGQAEDALITRAIEVGDSELVSRIGAYVDYDVLPVPPLVRTISGYLGASTYLLMSMSAGQETDAPKLSIHYRSLADGLIDKIIKGEPVLGSDGKQLGDGKGLKPIKSYTLSWLGVRS